MITTIKGQFIERELNTELTLSKELPYNIKFIYYNFKMS
jgi:hypothetical protein